MRHERTDGMARLDPLIEQAIFDPSLPDTTQIPLADGKAISLGALRATLPREYVTPADYESLRQQSDAQRQALLREKQALEQQMVEVLGQRQPSDPSPSPALEFWQTDPNFRPMFDKVSAVEAENASLKTMLA